ARVFDVDPNTVLHWLVEAAEQLRAFSASFLCDLHVEQLQLECIRISFFAAPVLLSPETREGHRAVRTSRWTRVAGCGIATSHGTQQTAGRQRHLQADLP